VKRFFLIIFSVFLIFVFFYYVWKFSISDVSHKYIFELIELGKYDDALKYIDIKLKDHSDNGFLYYKKAEVLFLKGEYDLSEKYLDKSIELGFPLTSSYNLKAVICEKRKNYDCQKSFSRKSIELDPTDYEGYFILAKGYFNTGDFEKSYENFKIAYEIERDENILLYISDSLTGMKKYRDAIKILYDLNKKYPDNPEILYRLYTCYKRINYYNNALFLLTKLHSINKDSLYIKERAELFYLMGDYISAFLEFKKYLSEVKKPLQNDLLFYKTLSSKIPTDISKKRWGVKK
jgi:tetratricopeptide (TPR) repeat protein